MNKILIPTGGLNLDDDLGSLPDGDYVESVNQIYTEGREGKANSIKKIEGFSLAGSAYTIPFPITGTVLVLDALADTQDDSIYYLCRDDVYGFILNFNVKTSVYSVALPRYEIGSHSELFQTKNLKKIGSMLFWNYAEGNMPCSWFLGNPIYSQYIIISRQDISMIRRAPTTSLNITITINASASNRVFEENDYQIAYRIVYISGERSVLGQPFQLYKARKNVEYLTIKNIMGLAVFMDSFEFYARKGNNGVWYRIATKETNADFQWRGEFNEVLDDVASSTPFHSIPLSTNAIEVSNNRVFLANNLYDLDNDRVNGITLTIPTADGYEIPDNVTLANPAFYLNGSNARANLINFDSLNDSDVSSWQMVFADNSSYYVGICFYDEYMRTPGVSVKEIFRTGKQTYPILPEVHIAKANSTSYPSWAKYFCLCVSDNLDIDYFYEGYSSYVFFQLELNGLVYYEKEANNDNSDKIKFIVIDMSAMLDAEHIYTFQEGDKCVLNTRDFFNAFVSAETYTISGQDGRFLYLDYKEGAILGTADRLDSPMENFIIYSPKDKTESVVFYPQGDLHPISLFQDTDTIKFTHDLSDALRLDRLIGDSVLKTFTLKRHQISPLTTKDFEQNLKTTVGNRTQTLSSYTINSTRETLLIDQIYQNNDGGYISSTTQYSIGKTIDLGQVSASVKVTITLNAAIDGELWVYFGVRDITPTPDAIILSDVAERKDIVAADGLVFTYDLYGSVELEAGDLSKDDLLSATILVTHTLNGGTTAGPALTGATILIESLEVSIKDYSAKVKGYEFDLESQAAEGQAYLVRAMNLKDNLSWTRDKSFGVLEQPNAEIKRRTNIIQHGGTYIENLLVNNVSSATVLDRGEVPFNNGPINALIRTVKTQEEGSVILAICEDETESVYINETILTNAGGSGAGLALSRTVISDTRTLKGGFGTVHPGSVVQRRGNVYFWDDLEKAVVRYSANGMVPISDIKMRSFFANKSGEAIGYFDPFSDCFLIYFKDDGENYSTMFREADGRWKGMVEMKPKVAVFFENRTYTIDNLLLQMRRSGGSTFCDFGASGIATSAKVKFVIATPIVAVPERVVIKYNSDVIDYARANYIKENLLKIIITNENGQRTTIYEDMFILEKGTMYAQLLRDELSAGGLIEGDIMEGSIHQLELIIDNTRTSEQLAILAVSLTYVDSHGHNL